MKGISKSPVLKFARVALASAAPLIKNISKWDVLGFAGAALISASLFLLSGLPWALMLWGVLFLALAVMGARRSGG